MTTAPVILLDPIESARAARLRYVTDAMPGIRRLGTGKAFRYVAPDGTVVRDPAQLSRIRSLVIPPAWRDVWICPIPEGHLQATGRDARRRKQYRYHSRWKEVRDGTKYGKMVAFGESLPAIRRRVERDLASRQLSREKVLATVVRLLELTCIRVGNEEYARMNRSFGLTTLRDRHVNVSGARLDFRFRGKSGKEHAVRLIDRTLARIVKRCRDLPGYELFQYVDENRERHAVDSADVNQYLRDIAGQEFTAKDFRTWAGTVAALTGLQRCGDSIKVTQRRKQLAQVIKDVAGQLGNTPAVSRKSYIHPSVLESYEQGRMGRILERVTRSAAARKGLRPEEALTLAFLKLASEADPMEAWTVIPGRTATRARS
jgi:DNA topoisomerase I